MAIDLFEELGKTDVPPPPSNLGERVHERVNRMLLVLHAVEMLVKVMPYAILHFAQAVTGLITYSVSGRFGAPPDGDKPDPS